MPQSSEGLRLRLTYLVDLALALPEFGAVNFTILHTIVHIIIRHLKINNRDVEFNDYGKELLDRLSKCCEDETFPADKVTAWLVGGESEGGSGCEALEKELKAVANLLKNVARDNEVIKDKLVKENILEEGDLPKRKIPAKLGSVKDVTGEKHDRKHLEQKDEREEEEGTRKEGTRKEGTKKDKKSSEQDDFESATSIPKGKPSGSSTADEKISKGAHKRDKEQKGQKAHKEPKEPKEHKEHKEGKGGDSDSESDSDSDSDGSRSTSSEESGSIKDLSKGGQLAPVSRQQSKQFIDSAVYNRLAALEENVKRLNENIGNISGKVGRHSRQKLPGSSGIAGLPSSSVDMPPDFDLVSSSSSDLQSAAKLDAVRSIDLGSDIQQLAGIQALLQQQSDRLNKVEGEYLTKDELECALASKVDYLVVDRKISKDKFEHVTDDLKEAVELTLEQLSQMESSLRQTLSETNQLIATKSSLADIDALKEEMKKNIAILDKKIKEISPEEDPFAAGAKYKCFKDLDCLSCNRKVNIQAEDIFGFPLGERLVPAPQRHMETLFRKQLDEIRVHRRVKMNVEKCDAAFKRFANSANKDGCLRYCGGRHTKLHLMQKIPRATERSTKGLPKYGLNYYVKGMDGKLYASQPPNSEMESPDKPKVAANTDKEQSA